MPQPGDTVIQRFSSVGVTKQDEDLFREGNSKEVGDLNGMTVENGSKSPEDVSIGNESGGSEPAMKFGGGAFYGVMSDSADSGTLTRVSAVNALSAEAYLSGVKHQVDVPRRGGIRGVSLNVNPLDGSEAKDLDDFSLSIMIQIKAYHRLLREFAQPEEDTPLEKLRHKLTELNNLLESRKSSLASLDGSKTAETMISDFSNVEAISEFQQEVQSEIKVVDDLIQYSVHGQVPSGLTLGEALAYGREGFSPSDAAKLKEEGLSAVVARQALSKPGWTLDEVAEFGKLGMDFHSAVQFKELCEKDGSNALKEALDLAKEGLTGWDALEWKQQGRSAQDYLNWKAAGKTLDDFYETILLGDKFPIAPKERELLEKNKLDLRVAIAYRRARVPITPQTMVGQYKTVAGSLKKIGDGKLSEVYATTYCLDRGQKRMIFKKEIPKRIGAASEASGIRKDNPQYGMRNIATKKVANLLGFGRIVPDTEFALQEGVLGIAMEPVYEMIPIAKNSSSRRDVTHSWIGSVALAHRKKLDEDPTLLDDFKKQIGATSLAFEDDGTKVFVEFPYTVVHIEEKDRVLQRELVKLQLLDALTGQCDRHAINYHIQQNEHGEVTRVIGIDNDQSFGRWLSDPNSIEPERGGCSKYRGVRLPPVVDTEMKAAFDRLTPEDLTKELSPLLQPDEVKAAISRLNKIKSHLNQCEVIDPDQWGGEKATKLLSQGADAKKYSYWARDRHWFAFRIFDISHIPIKARTERALS